MRKSAQFKYEAEANDFAEALPEASSWGVEDIQVHVIRTFDEAEGTFWLVTYNEYTS